MVPDFMHDGIAHFLHDFFPGTTESKDRPAVDGDFRQRSKKDCRITTSADFMSDGGAKLSTYRPAHSLGRVLERLRAP